MRTCAWVVCACVAYASAALAAPAGDARAKYQLAAQLHERGDYDQALVSIEEGLAIAPKDLALLGLKGTVLLKLRDYAGALAVYQAYLDAGARGANRREAQKIVNSLRAVESTFLDIALASGSAAIYLDSKAQGVFCTAAPTCNKAVLPGEYRVIAERPGFERWTGHVAVESDRTTKLAVALVELPSRLTVRVAQPGAQVTVDGAESPATIAAGKHQIAVTLAGHIDAKLEATAHEGKPVELDVSLTPHVPVRLAPATATLTLDGKPIAAASGSLAIPPGTHVLTAHATGFHDRRIDVPAERPAGYQLDVELAPVAVAAREPVSTRTRVASGLIEAGGVAIAAAIGLGFATTGGTESNRPMLVLLSAGGATVVAGVVLGITTPRSRPGPTAQIVPAIGGDQLGLAVTGRF